MHSRSVRNATGVAGARGFSSVKSGELSIVAHLEVVILPFVRSLFCVPRAF